jgi:hypothetical protein
MNRPQQCQWLGWFDRINSDEAIRLASFAPAARLRGLEQLAIEESCQRLDDAWRAIFVPGPEHIQILRTLLDQARTYARTTYPTIKDYHRLRCLGVQGTAPAQPIRCLTGLAGVSKSSLMRAFERICCVGPPSKFLVEGYSLEIHPVRRSEIGGQPAVRGILRALANPVALDGRAMNEISGLMANVSDWLMATATSTLVVDEMQFFTQSSSASTKTAQLIMTLANLGPPLVFIANYSLVNKLLLRPQEEKDRILAAPLVLNPPAADAPWWREALQEYLAVSPVTFKLDPATDGEELHRFTAGMFRALRQLLLQAYREARAKGRHEVLLDDVRQAYRSRTYSIRRKDVEDLASLSISNRMADTRPDLVCPFTDLQPLRRSVVTGSNTARLVHLPALLADAPAALIESTISPAAKATLRVLRKAANKPVEERVTATVTPLRRRAPISAQSLRQGA